MNFISYKSLNFADIQIESDLKIYWVKFHKNARIDEEESSELIEAVYPLSNEMSYDYTISDMSAKYIEVSKEARTILSKNKSLNILKANALIVNDLPSRIVTNFFIQFNKPAIPFKSFTKIEPAIQWLLSH